MRAKALAIGLSLLLVSLLLGACGPERGPAPPPPELLSEGGPSISVDKMVSVDGGANWVDAVVQNVCQNVQFQITVTNDGDVPLSNIVISDYLPDCLEYVDGPAIEGICQTQLPSTLSYNPPGTNTPTWTCSELAPGNSVQVIYTAHVVESGICKNQVSVEGEYNEEIVDGSGSATVTGITGQPPGWDDWGDAPASYPTLDWNNGAHHIIEGPWLGSARDAEPDGLPDASALGDDNDGNDDEDGITGLTSFIIGLTSTITIVVSGGGGYVQAWIDWNGDDDWAHPAEQVFNGYFNDGTYTIDVAVPSNAVVGQTFARFRISTLGNLSATGLAKDGEVEDYMIRIEAGQPPGWDDWGDAPASYPTLDAHNGAHHIISGPWLGSARDEEPDGLPEASALGDDNDGNDDEDGITCSSYIIIGGTGTFTIVVSGGGYVQAWIDWNGDDDWAHPAEQIFNSYLSDGTHTIDVAVPFNAVAGQTFARFRISLKGGLLPTGGAESGEVEDYAIRIDAGQPPGWADWGDAPAPYPTLNANNGASHLLNIGGPWLGSARDEEPDGLPEASALGDDNDGNDDEDGVTFTYHQDINTLDIEILVSGGGGYVQAWIDWNSDGDWLDSYVVGSNIPYFEYINIGHWADGAHTISFYVPYSAAATLDTFARFRISSQGNLSTTGEAQDGEVEDYKLSIF